MMKFTQTDTPKSTKMLRAAVNAGLEYELWNHWVGFGLLYTARFWEYKTMHNITGSVNFHPTRCSPSREATPYSTTAAAPSVWA